MLTEEKFIGKDEISQQLLANSFWIATLIDFSDDGELQLALLQLLKAWRPGPENRY